MAWAEPLHTRDEVAEAGRVLVADLASPQDREFARAVANNWRSSHAFPLNTLQINLRKVSRSLDADPTVAQRIKRLPSIESKLRRLSWLSLADMQDLGGCRAVLTDVAATNNVAAYYRDVSSMRHRLADEDDYITSPKRSGYRGIHLIYEYASDKKTTYNGHKIEMQLRSQQQHAWATAVETVGTFTAQALKSSAGEAEWLRFFALMSTFQALKENSPIVPGTPSVVGELIREIRALADRLVVVNRLAHYSSVLQFIERRSEIRRHHFLVLQLDPDALTLAFNRYPNAAEAAEAYNAFEARARESGSGVDVVLVRVESIGALRRAYPNYFADTSAFLEAVQEAIA